MCQFVALIIAGISFIRRVLINGLNEVCSVLCADLILGSIDRILVQAALEQHTNKNKQGLIVAYLSDRMLRFSGKMGMTRL